MFGFGPGPTTLRPARCRSSRGRRLRSAPPQSVPKAALLRRGAVATPATRRPPAHRPGIFPLERVEDQVIGEITPQAVVVPSMIAASGVPAPARTRRVTARKPVEGST